MPPRRVVTLTRRSLHDLPDTGLSGHTTPAERLALGDVLTRESWALAGLAWPTYCRAEVPVRVVRRALAGHGDGSR